MPPELGDPAESVPASIGTVHDYAGAWALERERCFRFVYDDQDGRPQTCPERPTVAGWRRDSDGRWYPVAACLSHAEQLEMHPRGRART